MEKPIGEDAVIRALRNVGCQIAGAFKPWIWKWLCRRMNLRTVLPSGIPLVIESFQDWCVVSEVFVRREYDLPIKRCLEDAEGKCIRVIDAGANVGYFSLRMVDEFLTTTRTGRLELWLFEPSPKMFSVLNDRLRLIPRERIQVRFHQGLVGKRSGGAVLFSGKEALANSIYSLGESRANRGNQGWIPFLDLEGCFPEGEWIDLLKCDIEGAEHQFVPSYVNLLRRTREFAVEVHEEYGDWNLAEPYLEECGLIMIKTSPALDGGEKGSVQDLNSKVSSKGGDSAVRWYTNRAGRLVSRLSHQGVGPEARGS